MRRRSNTLQADTVEDYINVAVRESSYMIPSRSNKPRLPSKSNHRRQFDDSYALDEETPIEVENLRVKNPKEEKVLMGSEESSDFWADFDFDNEKGCLEPLKSLLTLPSLTLSDQTADTDCSEDTEGRLGKQTKSSILKRIMVIGVDGCGKHALINTLFDCGQQDMNMNGQVMDLLTKTEEDEEDGGDIRYQFWIQNLHDDETRKNKLEDLIKLYYKNVSLFVFVYSITNKKSFECLGSAIQSVLQEVPADKFKGMLLGNKDDLSEERQVTLMEGISLQEDYKLNCFMETNSMNKALKERVVQLAREAESEGDLKAKQRYSILSID